MLEISVRGGIMVFPVTSHPLARKECTTGAPAVYVTYSHSLVDQVARLPQTRDIGGMALCSMDLHGIRTKSPGHSRVPTGRLSFLRSQTVPRTPSRWERFVRIAPTP